MNKKHILYAAIIIAILYFWRARGGNAMPQGYAAVPTATTPGFGPYAETIQRTS